MKSIFFFVILALPLLSIGQKGPVKETFNVFENHDIEVINIPFSNVEIIDARYDKSNIGCIDFNKGPFYKSIIDFPDSLNTALPAIISKIVSFKGDTTDKLMILVKKFRLTDYQNQLIASDDPKLIFTFSASFYAVKNNSYTRLFSIDKKIQTALILTNNKKQNFQLSRSEAFLKSLSQLLQNKNWQASSTAPHFTKQEIENGLVKRFDLPILKDTISKKGIYKTFQDFTQNKPFISNVNFTYRKGVAYIVDESNKKIDIGQFWGACDGSRKYIVFRNELNELLPSDNGFMLYAREIDDELAGSGSFGNDYLSNGFHKAMGRRSSNHLITWTFHHIDMETGEIHLEEKFGASTLSTLQKDLLKKR